jgi:hypothetical protein
VGELKKPLEDHFAEKLQAYTTPRDNPSRVKDLVDRVLMIERVSSFPICSRPVLGKRLNATHVTLYLCQHHPNGGSSHLENWHESAVLYLWLLPQGNVTHSHKEVAAY